MSDEESGNEVDPRRVFRTLPWRSDEATNVIERCDEALRVVRHYGVSSLRQPYRRFWDYVKPEFQNGDAQ